MRRDKYLRSILNLQELTMTEEVRDLVGECDFICLHTD